MKLIAEYLDIAIKFECLAAVEPPSKLKKSFEKQAAAYRKLAAKRARKLGILEVSPKKSSRLLAKILFRSLRARNCDRGL
jgi:hypothetical protein